MTDTWAALLETKENRIVSLERDCGLLEKELLQQQQQKEHLLQTIDHQQRHPTPPVRTGTPQQQQQQFRNSPVPNGPLLGISHKDQGVSLFSPFKSIYSRCFYKGKILFHLVVSARFASYDLR